MERQRVREGIERGPTPAANIKGNKSPQSGSNIAYHNTARQAGRHQEGGGQAGGDRKEGG